MDQQQQEFLGFLRILCECTAPTLHWLWLALIPVISLCCELLPSRSYSHIAKSYSHLTKPFSHHLRSSSSVIIYRTSYSQIRHDSSPHQLSFFKSAILELSGLSLSSTDFGKLVAINSRHNGRHSQYQTNRLNHTLQNTKLQFTTISSRAKKKAAILSADRGTYQICMTDVLNIT